MKKLSIAVSILSVLNICSCTQKTPVLSDAPTGSDEPVTISLATLDNMSRTEKNLLTKMKDEHGVNVDIRFYAGSDTTNPSEMLNLDMISGDSPDVLYVPTQTMKNFIKTNCMTDLYPLLESSPSLSQKDFLPNVIQGLDVDGKLPAICDSFIICTAGAKSRIVGETAENWTPQQALDFINSMPPDTDLLYNSSKASDVPYYLIERLAREAVDYKKNVCSFKKGFQSLLVNMPSVQENYLTEKSLLDDTAFIEEITIWGIDNSVSQQIFEAFGGEDVTFVGYPSETGRGYFCEASTMLGVPEASAHKAEAFELVSLMISDISVNSYIQMGIPVLEKRIENDLKTSKYTATSINCPVNIRGEEVQMPEEKIQKVLDYIKNVDFNPYEVDKEVNGIVRQEFAKFLDNEITPQQCAETLDDRISLYLSETN